jgi:hypothetical protein
VRGSEPDVGLCAGEPGADDRGELKGDGWWSPACLGKAGSKAYPSVSSTRVPSLTMAFRSRLSNSKLADFGAEISHGEYAAPDRVCGQDWA